MMDHLGCLTTFVAVVEKGGFAAAARHLSIAPATVTRQISTLEHRLGARLLQRTTRICTLTEAGQAFYQHGTKILEAIKDADAVAIAFHATSKGTIRLNASPTLAKDVSAIVARYAAIQPETCFDLSTTTHVGDFLGDRIDLAIRDDSVAGSSLVVRTLTRAEWTPCASPGHIARHGMPAHPGELPKHNCLIYAHGGNSSDWNFTDGNGRQSVRVSGNLRSGDPDALHAAALCDQGLVLLPDTMVSEDLDAGRLVRILNEYSAEATTVRAVLPSRRQISLKVRNFLDFAAMEFRNMTGRRLCAVAPGASARECTNVPLMPPAGRSAGGESVYPAAGLRSVVLNLAAARDEKRHGICASAPPARRD
jgi:DNA-binding transcriptional LysR family regulator